MSLSRQMREKTVSGPRNRTASAKALEASQSVEAASLEAPATAPSSAVAAPPAEAPASPAPSVFSASLADFVAQPLPAVAAASRQMILNEVVVLMLLDHTLESQAKIVEHFKGREDADGDEVDMGHVQTWDADALLRSLRDALACESVEAVWRAHRVANPEFRSVFDEGGGVAVAAPAPAQGVPQTAPEAPPFTAKEKAAAKKRVSEENKLRIAAEKAEAKLMVAKERENAKKAEAEAKKLKTADEKQKKKEDAAAAKKKAKNDDEMKELEDQRCVLAETHMRNDDVAIKSGLAKAGCSVDSGKGDRDGGGKDAFDDGEEERQALANAELGKLRGTFRQGMRPADVVVIVDGNDKVEENVVVVDGNEENVVVVVDGNDKAEENAVVVVDSNEENVVVVVDGNDKAEENAVVVVDGKKGKASGNTPASKAKVVLAAKKKGELKERYEKHVVAKGFARHFGATSKFAADVNRLDRPVNVAQSGQGQKLILTHVLVAQDDETVDVWSRGTVLRSKNESERAGRFVFIAGLGSLTGKGALATDFVCFVVSESGKTMQLKHSALTRTDAPRQFTPDEQERVSVMGWNVFQETLETLRYLPNAASRRMTPVEKSVGGGKEGKKKVGGGTKKKGREQEEEEEGEDVDEEEVEVESEEVEVVALPKKKAKLSEKEEEEAEVGEVVVAAPPAVKKKAKLPKKEKEEEITKAKKKDLRLKKKAEKKEEEEEDGEDEGEKVEEKEEKKKKRPRERSPSESESPVKVSKAMLVALGQSMGETLQLKQQNILLQHQSALQQHQILGLQTDFKLKAAQEESERAMSKAMEGLKRRK
jgi:hypothetical protein